MKKKSFDEVVKELTAQAMDYVAANKIRKENWGDSTDDQQVADKKEVQDDEYYKTIKKAAERYGVDFTAPAKRDASRQGETKLAAELDEGEEGSNDEVTKKLLCMVGVTSY